MSFNSIDIQVVFQKSHEVSRIQTLQQEQGNMQNQQTVAGLKQEFTRKEKAVNKPDYLAKKDIGRDGSKKGMQQKSKNKGKRQEEQGKNDSEEKILKHLGKHLDLHI